LPPDAFRPGYSGHDTKIYLARNLKRGLLPHFTQPAGAPDPVKFAELVQRPWCDAGFFSFDVPQDSMPNYAQAYAQCVADAVLLACCDGTRPEDRERLVLNIIQIGIAAYGDCWTGAKVVFTGHSGIDEATGIGRDYVRAGNPWGPYEHLPPAQWSPEQFRSDAYRRANTSSCFVAQALVLRTMKLEKNWNHDAFFDYADRWMFEEDKPFRTEIAKYCRPPYNPDDYLNENKDWFHEGYADQPWVKQLWTQYRPLSPAPTDGWKQPHDDSYYLNAIAKQRKP
jgi:hypothetical protein